MSYYSKFWLHLGHGPKSELIGNHMIRPDFDDMTLRDFEEYFSAWNAKVSIRLTIAGSLIANRRCPRWFIDRHKVNLACERAGLGYI